MAIEIKTKKFKARFSTKEDRLSDNGFRIFGEPSMLRQLTRRIEDECREKNPEYLTGEIKVDYVPEDGYGCAIHLPIEFGFDDEGKKNLINFVIDTIKKCEKEINPIEESGKKRIKPSKKLISCFFNEKKQMLQLDIKQWHNMDLESKKAMVLPFMKIMVGSSEVPIVGDGGPGSRYNEDEEKNFAAVFSNTGFGWEFVGTPQSEMIQNLMQKYIKLIKEEDPTCEFSPNRHLDEKIKWFSSAEPRKWKKVD